MADQRDSSSAGHGTAQVHEADMTDQNATGPDPTPHNNSQTHNISAATHQTFHGTAGSTSAPAPRANFPLPRELRDQIYGYLLDGKYTRVERSHECDRAYEFQTNILAVNREIHEEAERYLYANNTFVIINVDYNYFLDWLPFVASTDVYRRKKIFSAKYHSLKVSYREENDPSRAEVEAEGDLRLILETDLRSYCSTLSAHAIDRSINTALTLRPNGMLVETSTPPNARRSKAACLYLTFNGNPHCKAPLKLQSALISHFHDVCGFDVRSNVRGCLRNNAEVNKIEKSMSTGLLCGTAVLWCYFQAYERLKDEADAFLAFHELGIASSLYCRIFYETKYLLSRAEVWEVPDDVSCALFRLLCDTLVTEAHSHLKGPWKLHFESDCADVMNWWDLREKKGLSVGPRELFLHLIHLDILRVACLPRVGRYYDLKTIGHCAHYLRCMEDDGFRHHDAQLLESCPDQSKPYGYGDLSIESCSFAVLPPRCINLRKCDQDLRTPANIIGLLDLETLRKTNQTTRAEINRIQAEQGWRITPFDS